MTEKFELNNDMLEKVTGGVGIVNSGKKAKIVNCDAVNVRDSANHGDVIGTIRVGQQVEFHKWVGSWAYVTYRKLTGYVYKDYIKVG